MEIEILEIELTENNTRNEQVEAESIDLINDLELTGQRAFIGDNKETGVGVLMPYRLATQEQRDIIRFLFPEQTRVEDFKEEPIPLEVLKVIAFVRQNFSDEMGYLAIRHVSGIDKDPILIGAKNTHSTSQYYILARWGDALETWENLLTKAKANWIDKRRRALVKIRQEIEIEIANLDAGDTGVSFGDLPSFYK